VAGTATGTATPAVTAAAGRPAGAVTGRLADVARGTAGVLVAVALWELLRAVGVLPRDLAPSFTKIVPTFFDETFGGDLGSALLQTVRTWAAGMGVTLLIGIPLGLFVGLSKWADAATALLFDFLRPVPAVAFVPVAVVFFGLGVKMQVFLICIAAVWPVILNTRFGVRDVDPLQLDVARTMGAGRLRRLVHVTLPAALPSIFTGVRTSASIAVVLTVVSEIVASGTGIGGYIATAQQDNLPAEAFAGLLMAGIFGYAVHLATEPLEARVLAWHRESSRRA
jgi:ABC-type nitrate/sulfonate/bicarbonate transport system permease component